MNSIFVTIVTAKLLPPGENGAIVHQRPYPTQEVAMPHVAFADRRAYRLYDVELPYRVSGFLVGIGISKFKQIGVWDKFPQALKDKARAAKGSWAGLKITQKDLDSIPDDAWEKTAGVLGVKWKYATASRECGRGFAAAEVQREPGSILAGVAL